MNTENIIKIRPLLLILAIVGFLGINGSFLYYGIIDTVTYQAAMSNGLALVFVAEAFLLMFFFAFMIGMMGWKRPGWGFFILMSLLGSLAFSVPLQLYLMSKPDRNSETE